MFTRSQPTFDAKSWKRFQQAERRLNGKGGEYFIGYGKRLIRKLKTKQSIFPNEICILFYFILWLLVKPAPFYTNGPFLLYVFV
jgi:hypothetical protein